jgi:hypothetical protein
MERRKFIRIPSEALVTCKKYGDAAGALPRESALKNLSAEGILFQAKQQYKIGDVLKMELHLPGWQKFNPGFYKVEEFSYQKPLIALGTVVRIEFISEELYEIGVYLNGVDEGHRWALQEYIKHKVKE